MTGPFVTRATLLLAMVIMAALLGGCTTTGPTIGFRNDSDTFMKATYWVGLRDAARTGGAKMRAANVMEVRARDRQMASLMPMWHYRSASDTVVRVQVIPTGSAFKGAKEYWFELPPPSPYTIRAVSTPEGFEFQRDGPGPLIVVPEEFWAGSGPERAALPKGP